MPAETARLLLDAIRALDGADVGLVIYAEEAYVVTPLTDDADVIEAVLPGSILRKLSDEEMDTYRAPFREPGEGRRPTLTWPRQIPIEGEPADVVEIVRSL